MAPQNPVLPQNPVPPQDSGAHEPPASPQSTVQPHDPAQRGPSEAGPAPQAAEPPHGPWERDGRQQRDERREQDRASAPKYEPRADGGFGPKGSGGLGASGRSHGGRGPAQWSVEEDQRDDEDRFAGGFRGDGAFRRRESDDGDAPQYLVEADDLSDADYGEGRLVAPPVLGEGPPSYREF
jgi:hypothetical protein